MFWVAEVVRWSSAAIALGWAIVTLVSESRHPHFAVRSWEFPRLQIAAFAAITAVIYVAAAGWGGWSWWDVIVPLAMLAVIARQANWIWPYAGASKVDMKLAGRDDAHRPTVRVVISNLLQQNEKYDLWREVIEKQDADVIACAEVDERWAKEVGQLLDESHSHKKVIPQDNMYGMGLWSRLPLEDVEVEHIVQDDIPSIHATLVLPGGERCRLHLLHPRPPAPQEGDSSAPRDAELIVVAKRIADEKEGDHLPTLVVGDLNDVAWSRTTELFLRISGLLDPRKGRGLFNSFHAEHWWVRFPLDHVFVGREFRLVEMERLPYVGSDHFPMRIDLKLVPEKKSDQRQEPVEEEDAEDADEALATEAERERNGQEDGHLDGQPEAREAEART